VEHLVETGLIRHFLPESAAIGCDQPPEWHPEGDVFTHTMIMLDMLAPDAPIESVPRRAAARHRQAALPHHRSRRPHPLQRPRRLGAEMAETILRRLRYPNHTIDRGDHHGGPPHAVHERPEDARGQAQALHGRADLSPGKWSFTASIARRPTVSPTTTNSSRPRKTSSPPNRSSRRRWSPAS
jgi:hypothetical protein